MRSSLLLAVSFLIIGCADVRLPYKDWPASVQEFHGLSFGDQSIVSDLIDDLNEDLGMELVRIGGSTLRGYPIVLTKVASFPGHPFRVGYAKLRPDHCEIELVESLFANTDLLKSVFWHEVGHCAGLRHDDASDQIMSPTAAPFSSFSSNALTSFFDALMGSVGLN